MNFVALQAEHFLDVLEPHAIRISVDKEHRRLSGLELVRAEVVRLQIDRDDPLDEIREFVGRRTQLLVFGFDGATALT